MSKSIKLKNDNYIDSSGVVHEKEKLSDLLPKFIEHFDKEKQSETNLNNYVEKGIYQLSMAYQNAPISTTIYGVLIVITSRDYPWNPVDQSNWLWQVIFDTAGNAYLRTAVNSSTFNQWRRISVTSL